MATQKGVTDHLKKWLEASTMKTAVEEAGLAAREYDGLYEESAMNLLGRTPDLMLLLSAYVAGKEDGIDHQKQRQSVQAMLGESG